MNKLPKLSLLIYLILCCNKLTASEPSGTLSGIWKHDEQPVWVQISNQGHVISGVFLQHDVKPDLNGQLFIKEFSSNPNDPSLLAGLVYAARLKEFKAAEIEQNSADAFVLTATVKMGFIKRTVISNWSRSVGAPSEE